MAPLPGVTILIPTYARASLLMEAVASAQLLRYAGPIEVLVVNDFPAQRLRCTQSHVRVVNLPSRLTLGKKRDAMLHMTDTPFLCFLDDDDLLLPWHLQQLRPEAPATLPSNWITFTEPDRWAWGPVPGGINGMIVARDVAVAVGFPHDLDIGEDNAFRAKLLERYGQSAARSGAPPSYIYRSGWHTHISRCTGAGGVADPQRFVEEAAGRVQAGRELTGSVVIEPQLGQDYWGELYQRFPQDFPRPN